MPLTPQASIVSLWKAFLQQHPDNKQTALPEAFYFCDNEKEADECAALVVKGIKQATATSLWWFEQHQQPLPQAGDQAIVTDWAGYAKAIIETTRIELTLYNEITAAFAATEGEGDGSLAYWQRVHKAYYTREMAPFEKAFSEDMIIVCEYFKTIYTGA